MEKSDFRKNIDLIKNLNESSISRLYKHLNEHDCAIITSFRDKMINCTEKSFISCDNIELSSSDNKNRNKQLHSTLLKLGYGVTAVKGSYVENYLQDNATEVKEDSFFVVNLKDDSNFIKMICKLGEYFCQDAVLIMEKGGTNNYLIGTNESMYPGYGVEKKLGVFKGGLNGEFMTKIGGRPFVLETFDKSQINTKRLINEMSKEIISCLSQEDF